MDFDLIVAGSGPAGLLCASTAGGLGASVLLLEKMPSPGLKLLASGSGRCNLSHAGPIEDFLEHYGDHGRFIKPALLGFTNSETRRFFEGRGLTLAEEAGGKLFPAKGGARSVREILLTECTRTGVTLRCESPVDSASREERSFLVGSRGEKIAAACLCIATGGRSYPATGSSGDGFRLAAAFGHGIAEIGPALTPLYIEDFPFAACSGIALRDAEISLWHEQKRQRRSSGDVLFTHRGLSGPGALDFSRHVRPGDIVKLRLLPAEAGASPAELDSALVAYFSTHGKRSLKTCIRSLGMAENLAEALIAALGLEPAARVSDLSRAARVRVAESALAFPLRVESLGPWDEAMATRGGVELSEIDSRSMESKLVEGLFFSGEVMDLDGDTGGYNLQAALSTGTLAGRMAARRALGSRD